MSLTRLTGRDYVASAMVALIVVAYVGHLVWDGAPSFLDVRGVAATGLLLGWSAFIVVRGADLLDWTGLFEVALAMVSGILGLTTLVLAHTHLAETFLVAFVTSIVVVWAVELLDHLSILPSHRVRDPAR